MEEYQPFLLLLVCFLGSFFFSGTESGFVSWNPIKVKHKAASGDLFARWALYLMNRKDRLLSTVLIGNNICNIGASLSFLMVYSIIDQHVFLDLSRIPSAESWFLTPVMVLFAEMLPKSLFRTYPFRLTLKAIPILLICYFLTLPFTWLFTKFMNLFRKEPPGFEESFKAKVREEMVLVALEGSKRGTLIESADVLLNNVLKLKDRTIKDIMISISEYKKTHDIFAGNKTLAQLKKKIPDSNEILVFDEQGYNPIGVVAISNIAVEDYHKNLSELIKPIRSVEIQQSLLAAFQFFKTDASEFYLVRDKNSIKGIIQRMSLYREIFVGNDTHTY